MSTSMQSPTEKQHIHPAMVMTIASNEMGRGDEALGVLLMENFFHALTGQKQLPHTVAFFNTGALLVAKDSKILGDLMLLTGLGVKILVCGTCVKHFKIEQQLGIGTVSNMFEITSTMVSAATLIQL